MRPFKFITGTGTPALIKVADGASFQGYACNNLETSTVIYLKLWWQHGTTTVPIIGTTAPDITIPIPSTGVPLAVWDQPINLGGPCFTAVTRLAADADTTALVTGGEVVMLILN